MEVSIKIWKRDHYPGMHRASLQEAPDPQPRLEGAPNFRQLSGRLIYGVGQPTVAGLEAILAIVDAPCLWVNLREEPVLYLDGEPCTLRDREFPTVNPGDPGVLGEDLEAFEEGLRQEVEARGHVCVSDEGPGGLFEECGVKVARTVRKVFTRPGMDYHRVPITDERAPEVADFQALYELLRGRTGPRVFNCHAGRGRTTTAMIVADLVEQGPQAQPATVREPRTPVENSLWKAIGTFPASQELADAAIARSARLQDLRAALECADPPPAGAGRSPEEALALRARDYLRRYFLLLTFAEFVGHPEPANFGRWLAERPEKLRALERLGRSLGLAGE